MCEKPLQHSSRHGVPSVSCASCGFCQYDNPVAIAAALIETDEGIVLVRGHGWPEKAYGLVTGYIQNGESPASAAVREVKEELGLTAEIDHLIGVFPFAELNQILICYHLTASGVIQLSEEIVDVKSVPREKLRGWDFGSGIAVKEWLKTHGTDVETTRPIKVLLENLNRRWSLRILWELSRQGSLGFSALRKACDDVSPDTLWSRLKDLSEAGLVERLKESNQQGWQLTKSAIAMKPALFSLVQISAETANDRRMAKKG